MRGCIVVRFQHVLFTVGVVVGLSCHSGTGDQRGNVDAALRLLSACDGLVRLVSDVGDKIRLIGCQSIEPLNKALALSKEWRGSIASGDTVFQEDIPTATTTSPTSSGTPSQEEASEDARQLPLVVAGSLLLDEPSKEETLRRLITDCTQGAGEALVLGFLNAWCSCMHACACVCLALQAEVCLGRRLTRVKP